MILLDTNVLSELMRSHPNSIVVDWVDSYPPGEIGITAITVAEILYGIGILGEGKRKRSLLGIAEDIFDKDFRNRIFSFNHRTAVEYADIVVTREKLGTPISTVDAQIAAICRENDFPLATRNIKDFENTGIQLTNPWNCL